MFTRVLDFSDVCKKALKHAKKLKVAGTREGLK
jgi:hypothetical protein